MNHPPNIQQLTLENFTLFRSLSGQPHASLNIIIGENNTGKTHLLKLLYAVVRSLEEYQKKSTASTPYAVQLAKKLQWVFLPQKMELGQLVSKGQKRLKVKVQIQGEMLQFEFGKTTKSRIQKLSHQTVVPNFGEVKAIFLPPKEILSIFDTIVATREDKEILAYDDTYLDLVRDFRQPLTFNNKPSQLTEVWQALSEATGESEIVVEKDGSIWFVQGQEKYNVHQIAEGMRKIGILHRLIHNEMLTSRLSCVLFVDEPEINLHPQAQVQLADFLYQLSESGIQIYLSTHNYLVLKRFEQLARQYDKDLLLINLHRQKNQVVTSFHRLKDGLPANPIVEQSVALYQQDVDIYLQKRKLNN
jgi:predicted ATPase